jgi:hypothetical protein
MKNAVRWIGMSTRPLVHLILPTTGSSLAALFYSRPPCNLKLQPLVFFCTALQCHLLCSLQTCYNHASVARTSALITRLNASLLSIVEVYETSHTSVTPSILSRFLLYIPRCMHALGQPTFSPQSRFGFYSCSLQLRSSYSRTQRIRLPPGASLPTPPPLSAPHISAISLFHNIVARSKLSLNIWKLTWRTPKCQTYPTPPPPSPQGGSSRSASVTL